MSKIPAPTVAVTRTAISRSRTWELWSRAEVLLRAVLDTSGFFREVFGQEDQPDEDEEQRV